MIKDFEGKPENLCLRTLHLLFGVYNLYACRAFAWAKFADANVQKGGSYFNGRNHGEGNPQKRISGEGWSHW